MASSSLQIAFSVLLLTIAGLAYRSRIADARDLGFDPEPILIVAVGTPATSRTESGSVLDGIRQRLANIPNVTAVSYTAESLGFWNRDDRRVTRFGPNRARPATASSAPDTSMYSASTSWQDEH